MIKEKAKKSSRPSITFELPEADQEAVKKEMARLSKESDHFANMVNLLAVFTEATNRLQELETETNSALQEIIDEHKGRYASLQSVLTETEQALEVIAKSHPGWFQVRKSIKTPYGTLKTTSGTKLVAENEEVSIVLIQSEARVNPSFPACDYLRQSVELDREALEKLEDEELAKFRIRREKTFGVKVEAAQLDMGKAVQSALEVTA